LASGLIPNAVRRLVGPLQVAVRGVGDARDWHPRLGVLGQRLGRRFWPGPLILAGTLALEEGLVGRLALEVQTRLREDGQLQLRCPGHEAILEVLNQFPGPLLLGAAGDSDWQLVDGGAPLPLTTSVVGIDDSSWRMIRAGTITEEMLQHQSACLIVFVCTGNTCRSPLAEALLKKLLSQRLGCTVEELPRRGYVVISAGLAALAGEAAAALACSVAANFGGDLERHRSRPLTPDLAARADYLVAMTRGHVQALHNHFPRLGSRPRLLSAVGDDIADPIGQDEQVYQACGHQIWKALQPLAAQLCPESAGQSEG